MRHCNVIFLNKNELECLENFLIPYGLYVMNKELPSGVVRKSKLLINYIFADHLKDEIKMFWKLKEFIHHDDVSYILNQRNFCEDLMKNACHKNKIFKKLATSTKLEPHKWRSKFQKKPNGYNFFGEFLRGYHNRQKNSNSLDSRYQNLVTTSDRNEKGLMKKLKQESKGMWCSNFSP